LSNFEARGVTSNSELLVANGVVQAGNFHVLATNLRDITQMVSKTEDFRFKFVFVRVFSALSLHCLRLGG